MAWNPNVALSQDRSLFRVAASDAEAVDSGCALRISLKSRPETYVATGTWRREWGPFTLEPFLDAVKHVHVRVGRGTDLNTAITLAEASLVNERHAGVRSFLRHALNTYFEYHEAREAELGPMRLIGTNTIVPRIAGKSEISAWGPLYETADGTREIRRLRMGRAHTEHTVWETFAAQVAASARGSAPATRVFVTEVGLVDGVEHHLIAGISPDEASHAFEKDGRPVGRRAIEESTPTAGSDCSQCKATPVCSELPAAAGVLQVTSRGAWTRSVSSIDLATYDECPARWRMERDAHLPRDDDGNDALLRGNVVHRWLEIAHSRGVPCVEADLPSPIDGVDRVLCGETFASREYALAYPYLRHHTDNCPHKDRSLTPLAAEETLYLYDSVADVVPVVKPDAVWSVAGELVIREYKTTERALPADADEARDAFGELLPWMLVLLPGGLAQRFGATSATIELEVITPTGGKVFSYSTDDAFLMDIVRRRVHSITSSWNSDQTWSTNTGPHCERCSVRRWCPDRDAYLMQRRPSTQLDDPPF